MSAHSSNHPNSTGGSNPPNKSSPPRNSNGHSHHKLPTSAIFNVDDKPMIIIDQEDIRESTGNGSVTIVPAQSQAQQQLRSNPPQPRFSDVLKNDHHSTSSSVIGAGAWSVSSQHQQQQQQSNGAHNNASAAEAADAAGYPGLTKSSTNGVDLANVLSGDWPENAGHLKDILKTQTSPTEELYASNGRCRSANLMKHFGSGGTNKNGGQTTRGDASGANGNYGKGGGRSTKFDDAFGESGATGLQQTISK